MKKAIRLVAFIASLLLLFGICSIPTAANEQPLVEWEISQDGETLSNNYYTLKLFESEIPLKPGDSVYYQYANTVTYHNTEYEIWSIGKTAEVVLLKNGDTYRVYATKYKQKDLQEFLDGGFVNYFCQRPGMGQMRASWTQQEVQYALSPTETEIVSVGIDLLYKSKIYNLYAQDSGGNVRYALGTVYAVQDGRVFALDPSLVNDRYLDSNGNLRYSTDYIDVIQIKSSWLSNVLKIRKINF